MKLLRTLLTAGLATVAFAATLQAQPVVDQEGDMGLGTLEPHPSAILDLTSTTKGFLGPRMTTVQRDAIAAPAAGLVIYNTDDSEYQYFDGFLWIPIGLTAGPFWELDGNSVSGQYVGGGPGNGEFIGTIDGNDMSIATTVAANIDFWTSDVERFSIDAATGDIVPTVTNTISLGTDANRFADVFVDGASVHVGDAIGAELVVGYAANVGTLNVDGSASPQIAMDAATAQVNVDPAGDGTINFFVSEALGVAGFDVDSDGNGELGIGPLLGGIVMDANSDGVFDVEVDLAGDLIANNNAQVTGDLNVDGGTLTRSAGAFNLAAGKTLTASNGGQVDFTGGYDLAGGSAINITDGFGGSLDAFTIAYINDLCAGFAR